MADTGMYDPNTGIWVPNWEGYDNASITDQNADQTWKAKKRPVQQMQPPAPPPVNFEQPSAPPTPMMGQGGAAPMQGGGMYQPGGGGILGNGGLSDRFMSPMTMFGLGLASGRTPQEGIGNAAKLGFQGAQFANQQQSQRATYHALLQSGVPPGVALAAAQNPDVLKTIAPNLYTKPELVETGTDPLSGQKSFMWKIPNQMALQPAQMGGGAATQGMPTTDTAGAMARISAMPEDASVDEKLAMAPKEWQPYLTSLIKGTAAPMNMGRVSGNTRAVLLNMAHQIDPNFDETKITERQNFAKSMGNQSIQSYGGQVTSAGTIVNHAAKAQAALHELLGQSQFKETMPVLNHVEYEAIKQGGTPRQKYLLGEYEKESTAAAGELERLQTGGRGTGAERGKHESEFTLRGNAPSKVLGAWHGAEALMLGRLGEVGENKARAFGGEAPAPESLLSPTAQQQLKFAREKRAAYMAKAEGKEAPSETHGERGAKSEMPPPPAAPEARTKGKVYMTPKGPMKWTGTGWKRD